MLLPAGTELRPLHVACMCDVGVMRKISVAVRKVNYLTGRGFILTMQANYAILICSHRDFSIDIVDTGVKI